MGCGPSSRSTPLIESPPRSTSPPGDGQPVPSGAALAAAVALTAAEAIGLLAFHWLFADVFIGETPLWNVLAAITGIPWFVIGDGREEGGRRSADLGKGAGRDRGQA